MEGGIYRIGEENMVCTGEQSWKLLHLPITDYPLLLISTQQPFCAL